MNTCYELVGDIRPFFLYSKHGVVATKWDEQGKKAQTIGLLFRAVWGGVGGGVLWFKFLLWYYGFEITTRK